MVVRWGRVGDWTGGVKEGEREVGETKEGRPRRTGE